jgi:DNA-binding NarL/FixJ family response regulator
MSGEGAVSIRLLIADDHALVRSGLRTMLQREPGIEIVGEARNGREAVELCRSLRPDLILMDVRMPEMDGLEATRAVKRELPDTGVLMVTMHENRDYILEATKAGAAGYVLKDASRNELLSAVRRVVDTEPSTSQAAQPGHGVFG